MQYLAPICGVFAYLLLLPFFRFQINPDAVAYIAVAQKYLSGNWQQAFNGYWSPLISWLIAPLIACGVPALLSFKLINLIACIVICRQTQQLCSALSMPAKHSVVAQLLTFSYAMRHGLCASTPDVLSAAVLTGAVNIASKLLLTPASWKLWIELGVISSLAYYAKHYNIVGCTAIYVLLFVCLRNRTTSIKHILSSGLLFIVLCLPWATGIKEKYGKTGFSTASAFNLQMLKRPEPPQPGQKGDSLLNIPYEEFLYTSLEDPTYYAIEKWNPLRTSVDFADYLIYRIPRNIYYTIKYQWHILIPLLFLAGLYWRSKRKLDPHTRFFIALIFMYPLGYLLLANEYRYMIISECIGLILVVSLAGNAVKRPMKRLLMALLFLIPAHTIITYPKKGKTEFEIATQLNQHGQLTGKEFVCSPKCWNTGVFIAFHTKSKLHDSLKPMRLHLLHQKTRGYTPYYLCEKNELSTLDCNYTFVAESDNYVLIQPDYSL